MRPKAGKTDNTHRGRFQARTGHSDSVIGFDIDQYASK